MALVSISNVAWAAAALIMLVPPSSVMVDLTKSAMFAVPPSAVTFCNWTVKASSSPALPVIAMYKTSLEAAEATRVAPPPTVIVASVRVPPLSS